MLDKYLIELINSNNRVIIPDFGAFMIQDSPEGKQISFNDFLRFNDGLLVNQIIKEEKVNKDDALNKIKSFVKEVNKVFTEKKPYEIKGLGFLTKDSQGNIKFEKTLTAEKKSGTQSSKPATPAAKTSEKKKETEKKQVTPPQTKPTPAASVKTSATVNQTVKKPQSAAKRPTAARAVKTTPKPHTQKRTATSTNSSNNTAKTLIIIVAAVIIIGGGYWAFMKFDLISIFKKDTPPQVVEVTKPVVEVPVADTIASDTIVSDTTNIQPQQIEATEKQPTVIEETVNESSKKFYLIGGSFKVFSNAEQFNQKLISEGYESEIIVRDNGFHCVSYKGFDNWNDIVNEWNRMKSTNPNVWILIK